MGDKNEDVGIQGKPQANSDDLNVVAFPDATDSEAEATPDQVQSAYQRNVQKRHPS